jgi:hypothetical protein
MSAAMNLTRPTPRLLLAACALGAAAATWSCGDPLADLSYRGPVVVRGMVGVSPSVTCRTSDPLYDCRGLLLFVALIDRPQPLPESTIIASTQLPGVDLNDGQQVSYEIRGVPAGSYYISAMLAKSSIMTDPPFPKTGDLAVAPQPVEVKEGIVTERDILLDIRWK